MHLGACAPYGMHALGMQDVDGAFAEAGGSNSDLVERPRLGLHSSSPPSAGQRDSAVLVGEGLPPSTSDTAMHGDHESVQQLQEHTAHRHLLGDRPPKAAGLNSSVFSTTPMQSTVPEDAFFAGAEQVGPLHAKVS